MKRQQAPRIAVVDDEASIREIVGSTLRQAGYRVEGYRDGEEAWESFSRELPDLAILDILMPRMDGLELCRRIRSVSDTIPLIFLSSRDDELDRVLGLELGADDYLCKPFSNRELLARIRVLFRRLAPPRSEDSRDKLVRCGSLELDPQRHTVRWKDTPVALTVTEFRILGALAGRPGYVKTREQLLQEGYPYDEHMSDRNVDGHIKRIRRKLSQAEPGFDGIETIYGLGYRYRPDR
ncbi:MAG: response regulator transcription factor [Spirochaetales bacterium]|nr:response regulator transcription factor [Spirochaetales bacterium]